MLKKWPNMKNRFAGNTKNRNNVNKSSEKLKKQKDRE
jgi:hypothetical protein